LDEDVPESFVEIVFMISLTIFAMLISRGNTSLNHWPEEDLSERKTTLDEVRAVTTMSDAPSEHYVRGSLQCRNWYAKITIIFCQSNFHLHYDFFINPAFTHTHRPSV